MQQKENHFIKNIEIKNFKCFEDFKAEGFGRVNLIGGKNNVGKTAFMEACYLSQSKNTENLFGKLIEIKTHRDIINNLLSRNTREENILELLGSITNDDYIIIIRNAQRIALYKEVTDNRIYVIENKGFDYLSHSDLYEIINSSIRDVKYFFSINFISPYSNSNEELENLIGESKLDNKYENINQYLLEVFNVTSIDIIKNKPMLKSNGIYRELSHFGQGIKTFINIISSILLLEDDILFIDEIENGIHYTNLDKLWEIILTISKQQNVQVFATTHSKECIESYARVAKKLEDEDTKFIELFKHEDEIKTIVLDNEMLEYQLKQNHEVR